MATVEGIGGVFIESENAAQLARWYEEVLGIKMEAHPEGTGYYHVFNSRDAVTQQVRENPVFAINQAGGTLAEQGRGFTLNLRVDRFEEMMAQLRAKGVAVEDNIIEWERGKHGWIKDLDGNKIEIYEEIFPR